MLTPAFNLMNLFGVYSFDFQVTMGGEAAATHACVWLEALVAVMV